MKNRYLYIYIFLAFFNIQTFAQLSEKDEKTVNNFVNTANECLKNDESKKAANLYYKAGMLCFKRNQNLKAIPYLSEASKIFASKKDYEKVMKIYTNLGLLYANMDEYDKSIKYFKNSLKIRINLGNKAQIAAGLLDLAHVLSAQGKSRDAIISILKALEIANENQEARLVLISYRMLAENYQKIGNEQKAAEYLDKYASYRQHFQKTKSEELVSDERIKSIAELSVKDAETRAKQLEYEIMKRDKEFSEDTLKKAILVQDAKIKAKNDSIALVESQVEQEKIKAELIDAQRQKEKAQERFTFFILTAIILFIVIVLLGVLYFSRKRKKHNKLLATTNAKIAEQNKNIEQKNSELTAAFSKIEEQNTDINSSINYSVNIQKSLLPKQEHLENLFEESFILFKPRDKVSGDFYWFKEAIVYEDTEEIYKKTFISAIDCTGHGVPGAFLSMISFNLLENIIEQKQIYEPAHILDELHIGIRKSLRQYETSNQDGMDMALCSFDPQTNILEYAGAKNPLIYIQNGEIKKIKGNVKPIGGLVFEKLEKKEFDNHSIKIDEPTSFYLFSDGFADQTGEQTGRKLMSKYFRNLLFEIHSKPMKEQRQILSLFLRKWQGKVEQVDDILVMGFKINPNKI